MEKITKTMSTTFAKVLFFEIDHEQIIEDTEKLYKAYDNSDEFFKDFKKAFNAPGFIPLKVKSMTVQSVTRSMSLDKFVENAHTLSDSDSKLNLVTRTIKASKVTVLVWYDGSNELFKEESYTVKERFENPIDACKFVQKRYERDGKRILKCTAISEVSETLGMPIDLFVELSDVDEK